MRKEYLMTQSILSWYQSEYPTDEMGEEIKPDVTWQDLFDCLDFRRDVYQLLFGDGGDSLIRERCFARLAELMEVDYSYVYDQWMLAAR